MININNLGSIHPTGGLRYNVSDEKSGFKNKRNISLSLAQSSLKCKEAKCGRGKRIGAYLVHFLSDQNFPQVVHDETLSKDFTD